MDCSLSHSIDLFSIKSLDQGQEDLSKEVEQMRSKFRRCEREWLAEKETLHRKLQLCQQFSGGSQSRGEVGREAFFTEQRSAQRTAGETRMQKRMQQLNVRDEGTFIYAASVLHLLHLTV